MLPQSTAVTATLFKYKNKLPISEKKKNEKVEYKTRSTFVYTIYTVYRIPDKFDQSRK